MCGTIHTGIAHPAAPYNLSPSFHAPELSATVVRLLQENNRYNASEVPITTVPITFHPVGTTIASQCCT